MGKNLKKIVTMATVLAITSTSIFSAVPAFALDINQEQSVVEQAGDTGKGATNVTLYAEDFKEYDSKNVKIAGDFEYYVSGDSIVLTKYVGSDEKVKIAEDFNGQKITAIAKNAFKDCTTVKSIEISQYVTSIDPEAFTGCTSLESFTATNNKVYQVMNNVLYTMKQEAHGSLRELVKVPQTLTSDNYSVEPDTFKIDDHAFEGCSNIKSITIPSSVIIIGNQGNTELDTKKSYVSCAAFSNCNSLENITFNSSADPTNDQFSSEGGVLFNKDKTKLIKCPQNSKSVTSTNTYTIPDNVEELVDNAFQGCANLQTIGTLSLKKIGDNAFDGCGISTVRVDAKVETVIGKYAFNNCANLTTAEIGSLVTNIGYGAFNSCPKLSLIKVDSYNNYYTNIGGVLYAYNQRVYKISPDLDKLIEQNTTSSDTGVINNTDTANDKSLTGVTLQPYSTFERHYTIDGSGAIQLKTIISGNGTKNSVESVKDAQSKEAVPYKIIDKKYQVFSTKGAALTTDPKLFKYSDLKDTTDKALAKLEDKEISLTLVRCPQGVDANAVASNLSSSMEQKVNNIEAFAFQGCTSLKEIQLPDSMINIGGSAFKDCTALTSIKTSTQNVKLKEIGTYAFSGCSAIKSIDMPTLTSINAYTFNNCSGLEEVRLGAGISYISNCAFDGCSSLKNIITGEGATQYYDKNGVLYNKSGDNVYLVKYPSGRPEASFEVPEEVTFIGSYAFRDSGKIKDVKLGNLKEIVLPSQNIIFLDNAIFEKQFNEQKDKNKEFISLRVNGNIDKDSYFVTGSELRGNTFMGVKASSEGTVTIPKGSDIIVKGAFNGLKVKKLVIPTDIVTIDEGAFDNLTIDEFSVSGNNFAVEANGSLMQNSKEQDKNKNTIYTLVKQPNGKNGLDYTAPENTTAILNNAFQNCDFSKINLGDKVSSVNAEAFNSCPKLAQINVAEANADFKSENGVLLSKDGKTLIKYPAGKTEESYKIPDSVVVIKKNAFAGNTYLNTLKTSHENVLLEDGAFGEGVEGLKPVVDTSKPPEDDKPTLQVASIEIKKDTIKTSYAYGSALDLSSSMMTVKFDNNTTKDMAITADIVSGYDANKVGPQDVTVTYGGKTATFQVVVSGQTAPGATVKSIKLDDSKLPKNYTVGQDLNLDTATLVATMSDGTTQDVKITKEMITGYDKYKAGKQTVTITYGGQVTTAEVTVSEAQAATITEISLVPGTFTKTSYEFGEDLDISKAQLLVKKSDGTTQTVNVTADMISGYNKETSATQKVTITYGGKSVQVEVTVAPKTGDKTGVMALGSLLVAAMAGIVATNKKKHK